MAQYWFKLLITIMLFFVTSTTNAFDAYMVAAQWPPTVCRLSPAKPCLNPIGGNSFTVHGVWPINTNSNIKPPICSPADNFDTNIPPDQKAVMDKIWPDLKNGNNLVFWGHEWDDHGKCSGLNQVDYFWKCVQLWGVGNLDARLANAGLVTSNTQKILISKFQSQLATQMEGVEPIVTCTALKGNNYELKEIRFCFNMTNNFVPCGTGVVDKSCGSAPQTTYVLWSK